RDAHRLVAREDVLLFLLFPGILRHPGIGVEMHALRIARCGHGTAGMLVGHVPQMLQPAIAHHLDVAHHMGMGNGNETRGAEEVADLNLEFDRFPHRGALVAAQHREFLLAQPHGPLIQGSCVAHRLSFVVQSAFAPDSLTNLLYLRRSASTNPAISLASMNAGLAPCACRRSAKRGSRVMAPILSDSSLITSGGVAAGANTPCQFSMA